MTEESLTGQLAQRIMGWNIAPDRFLKGARVWIPRWRFQPFRNIGDAFELLDVAKPDAYTLGYDGDEVFARIRVGGRIGEARSKSRPEAISLAIASAYGLLSSRSSASARPKRISR